MARATLRGALFASASIVCMVAMPAAAQAAAQTKQFSIEAQPAQTAIGLFGHQADVQIIAARRLTQSVRTNGVRGEYTVGEALNRLFAGTGLVARQSGPRTYVVVPRPNAEPTGGGAGKPVAMASQGSGPQEQSSAPAVQAPAAEEGATIVVTGLRASLDNSRGIKRAASGIVDAISTKDIGKLPDANLAESLQRITGVSIDRSGGEGAFVTVRGFGPEFNTVLVNGRQIATPTDPSQASGRAFSFDTLASELVSGVEVYKSSTARYQSGGVGSTVNIKTARPFDYKGMKFAATVDANYDGNAKKSAPDASFLFADTLADGKLGVLLSGSYQHRFTKINQAQTDGWLVNPAIPGSQVNGGKGTVSATNPQGNIFIPQNFDSKVTREDRERIGGTLVLQYRPNDAVTVTADGLYTKFTNTTDARSYGHWFTASNLTNVKTDANGTVIDMTQASGIATDFHDKKFDKRTNTRAVGLNVEWQVSPNLVASLDGSYSLAKEDPNGGKEAYLALLGYLTGSSRYQSDGSRLPWQTETLPTFANPTNRCGSAVTDSGQPGSTTVVGAGQPMCQHVMLLRGYGIRDEVKQLRADLAYKGDGSEGLVKASAGFYGSEDRKRTSLYSNDGGTGCTTCGYNLPVPSSVAITTFNAGSNFLSGVSGSNRLPTQWLTFSGPALFDAITAQQGAGFTFAPPLVNDTIVKERVLGGYLETEWRGNVAGKPISIIAGVRFEDTSTNVNGLATAYTALVKLANDQTQYGSASSGTTRTVGTAHYLDILPNIALKWQLSDAFTVRFAASQTITRPTLEQLSPVTTLVTLRPGNFAASRGNADLKPFKASNLDLSFEYYYGRSSYVSLGGYLKSVNNFIVLNQTTGPVASASGSALLDPATGTPAQFTITAPVNGQDATVTGLEAAWQHAFGDTGFGFQVNGTLVGSNRHLDPQDLRNKFALTGLSNSANAVAFYDNHGIEARVAFNWRDHFLQYLAPPPLNGAGQAVTQVRAYSQVDASLTYHINQNVAVFVEGANLTNTIAFKYAYYSNQFLNAEDSGRRFKLGARISF
ncbi:TonB-dependent receptor [uncultured Sphingomonas sp.]|uniref:TonB-dependent receptor n=1 Tax=uncultured Sphingomonas sp. TaxID=158754 RepID=UPI0025DE1FC7|nr:TonB-dependent receptor [uncultured Sphingomonas sp.]